MDPAALAAAAQADEIPSGRKWALGWRLLLVLGAPAAFWAVLWFLFLR